MDMLKTPAPADYRAVVEKAGLIDLSQRGKMKVVGPDRVGFLHAMISNDVERLSEHAGRYSVFLTAGGKIICDFFCYKLPEFVLVDIESKLLVQMRETLQKYIIMDDVELQDVSADWGHLSLQGPLSVKIARGLLGAEAPASQLEMTEATFRDWNGWLIRKSSLARQGVEIIFPAEAVPVLRGRLLSVDDVLEVGSETAEVLRVERSIPRFGVDMDEKNYPMEARLDHAVSLDKGCYIGQEVVSKATYIGGVNRWLIGLRLDGKSVPRRGARVFDGTGKPVGTVTSSVFSPRLAQPIALAYLKRALAKPGSRFSVELDEGGQVEGELTERFLSAGD